MAPSEARTREELDALDPGLRARRTPAAARSSAPTGGQKLRQAYVGIHAPAPAAELPWVGCLYPTEALAQEAGMTLADYADFVFGACLLDWEPNATRMRRYMERFDAAETVRHRRPRHRSHAVDLAGRSGLVDDGHYNMPGGEFFYSPLEDSAEGVVEFSEFPALYQGAICEGVRLRSEGGRVVDASATRERGVPARRARHRRGGAAGRRARDRLQPRHPAAHAEHALRREDRRDDAPRGRRRARASSGA